MLFWADQIISWVTIALGWWILHQTAHACFSWGALLMRLGIGGFTLFLVGVTLARELSIPVVFAAPVFKSFLAVMFLGIAIFHRKRFGRL